MSHKTSWIILIILTAAFALWALTRTSSISVPSTIEEDSTKGWNTSTTTASGLVFKFPADLNTLYITPTDWPPLLNIDTHPFTCNEAGLETARAGQTTQNIINNHTYCITRESEGAAGSTYTHYAYARARDNATAILTFSMRLVQCGNYDEPKKTECETERARFNAQLNTTVDTIFKTIQ